MPARIYSHFPERTITNPNPPANPKPGKAGTVNEKTASWPGLPGKPSNGFRMTAKKVKIHPSSQGLC